MHPRHCAHVSRFIKFFCGISPDDSHNILRVTGTIVQNKVHNIWCVVCRLGVGAIYHHLVAFIKGIRKNILNLNKHSIEMYKCVEESIVIQNILTYTRHSKVTMYLILTGALGVFKWHFANSNAMAKKNNIHFDITRTPLKCKRWYKFTISKTDKPFKCILPLAAPKIVILKTSGTANGKYFRDVKKIVNGIGMFPGFHHSIKFSIGVLRKECGTS